MYIFVAHSLFHSQMMVYVVEQLVEEFETDATKPDSIDMIANKVDLIQHDSRSIQHFDQLYMYVERW